MRIEINSRAYDCCTECFHIGHTYMWQTYGSTRYGCQPCTWSAEQGKLIFPCPRWRLRIWSRETGSAVPSRASLLISKVRLNLVLTCGIPPEFRGGVHLVIQNRHHWPSGQSCVYRVTQLRTDSVHCRESTGTGPVNVKVVPNEYHCLGRSPSTS